MPNPKGLGLPHEQSFTVTKVGDAEVVVDEVTHLMWQRTVNENTYSWDQAIEFCDRLELAGHSDWRLPARIELISLIDFTRSMELSPPSPAIDPDAFPNTPAQWFWSSSPAAGAPSNAWHVYFYFGYVDFDDVGSSFRVRCVRS